MRFTAPVSYADVALHGQQAQRASPMRPSGSISSEIEPVGGEGASASRDGGHLGGAGASRYDSLFGSQMLPPAEAYAAVAVSRVAEDAVLRARLESLERELQDRWAGPANQRLLGNWGFVCRHARCHASCMRLLLRLGGWGEWMRPGMF